MLVDTALEFRRRKHTPRQIAEIFYNNPCRFFGQSPKWKLAPIGGESSDGR